MARRAHPDQQITGAMYDTITVEYGNSFARGVSFLEEIPLYLDTFSENSKNGWPYVTGKVKNLEVYIDESRVKVAKGSIAKFFFGDNMQTMTLQTTKQAFEKLSDTLHLPMEQARVIRFDLGTNLLVRHSTGVYLSVLGVMQGFERFEMPNSVYYKSKSGKRELVFYDKIVEAQATKADVPELYAGRNVLRYESRYKSPAKIFNVSPITGATLYSQKFYIAALNKWRDDYKAINKVHSIKSIDFEMKSVSEFNNLGRLLLIEKCGGESAFMNDLQAKQRRGQLTSKQAHDLRKAAKEAINAGCCWTETSDAVAELDKLVTDSVKYYR